MTKHIFTHSGDLGDIIYSLPAIRAKGGGKLILFDAPGKTAHGMTEAKMLKIKPLLMSQEYITDVDFSESLLESSLNGFRHHGVHGNLADMHLATQGLSWEERTTKWLTVTPNPKYKVIFVKTKRYNNPLFNWKKVYDKYKDDAVFFGFKEEHAHFEQMIGSIPLIEETNFLTIAEYIAGCTLYVGNYTALSAIAEGLKHPRMILEVYPKDHHLAVFERFGCLLAWDHKIELPEL